MKKRRDKTIARAAQALAVTQGKPEPSYQWALSQVRLLLAADERRGDLDVAHDVAARARS